MIEKPAPGKYMAAVGMFDGVHRGHAFLLDSLCRKAADRGLRPLAVTFDSHPLSFLAPARTPASLCTPEEKKTLIERCGVGNALVLPFREIATRTAAQFLNMLRDEYGVQALGMGFNNHIGSDRLDAAGAAALGIIPVETFDRFSDVEASSSAVRTALAHGNVEEAAQILGRNYSISGRVEGGKRLGRTIGFPTANIALADPSLQLPADGVYAVDVLIEGESKPRRGMANIGLRPTVDSMSPARRSIEVHILDFNSDIYNRVMRIFFLKRLRDERRFDSLESLSLQLHTDRDAAATVKSIF